MYRLEVFHPGERLPVEAVTLSRAADVLLTSPELLAKHAQCEKVVVSIDCPRLFSADCKGNAVRG